MLDQIKTIKLEDSKTLITPLMAKELMKGNNHNRKFRTLEAKRYARQMRLGRWKASPEPLIITDAGRIVSAQHRLDAVIDTGLSQEFIVTVIKDEEFDNIFEIVDQGATRSIADILRAKPKTILPLKYLLRVAGVAKPQPQDIEPFLKSKLGDLLVRMDEQEQQGKIWRSTGFKAAMAIAILSGVTEEEEAFDLYENLNTTAPSEWPHIFAALFMQLSDTKSQYRSGSSVANDQFCRPLYCFENHKKNTKTIRIAKSRLREMEAKVLTSLHSLVPTFLD